MTIKKITAVITAIIVMLSSVLPCFATEDTEIINIDTSNFDYLVSLGIMDDVETPEDFYKNLTRGRYVDILIRFLGVDPQEVNLKTSSIVYDVTEYMDFYEAVYVAIDLGIVNGNGDGTFLPDEEITISDAIVMLLRALKYSSKAENFGPYPTGYNVLATQLGLYKGVNLSDDKLSLEECANILYNALEIDAPEVVMVFNDGVAYRSGDGKTVLEAYHEISSMQGTVVYQRYENEGNRSGYIELDNGEQILYNGSEDLVGKIIEVFYREDEDAKEKYFFRYNIPGNVETITLNPDDVTFKDFVYTTDSGKKYRIENTAQIFYNGVKVSQLKDESILDPKLGTIEIIRRSNKTILNVYSYTEAVANSVNIDEKIVYDKYSYKNAISYKDINYIVLNQAGEMVDIEGIKENTVILSAKSLDGKKLKLITSTEKISGVISEKEIGTDETTYVIDGVAYKMSPVISTTNAKKYNVGDTVTAYLNALGYISNFDDEEAETVFEYAYLIDSYLDTGINHHIQLKILNDEGSIEILKTGDSLRLDGDKKKDVSICFPVIGDDKVIRYRLNSQGEVYNLDLPASTANDYATTDNMVYEYFDGAGDYLNTEKMFNGNVVVRDSTIKFFIPENPKDAMDYDFSVNDDLIDGSEYTIKAYKTSKDSIYAEAVVVDTGATASSFSSGSALVMVNAVVERVNQYGEVAPFVKGYRKGEEVVLELKESSGLSAKNLEGGDIIRCLTDSKDRIYHSQFIWDRSAEKPYQPASNPSSASYDATYRVMYGAVYSSDGEYFRLAIDQNNLKNIGEGDLIAFMASRVKYVYILEETASGKWFRKGSIDDLIPYLSDNVSYSKLLLRQWYSDPEDVIIIK